MVNMKINFGTKIQTRKSKMRLYLCRKLEKLLFQGIFAVKKARKCKEPHKEPLLDSEHENNLSNPKNDIAMTYSNDTNDNKKPSTCNSQLKVDAFALFHILEFISVLSFTLRIKERDRERKKAICSLERSTGENEQAVIYGKKSLGGEMSANITTIMQIFFDTLEFYITYRTLFFRFCMH